MDIWWVDKNGHAKYEYGTHAIDVYGFLYWRDQDLLIVFPWEIQTFKEMIQKAVDELKGKFDSSERPVAGGFANSGSIRSWAMPHADIHDTIRECREKITAVLGLVDLG